MIRSLCLLCCLLSVSCQRMRLDVDDLQLRCGSDAYLVDIAQWIEVFSDYGKPSVNEVKAAMIGQDLEIKELSISSKGCVAVPRTDKPLRWIAIRANSAGTFGSLLEPSSGFYRRAQLSLLPESQPSFDCPKPQAGNLLSLNQTLGLSLTQPLEEHQRIQLELGSESQLVQTAAFDLSRLPEGNYTARLRLLNLLNFTSSIVAFERSCPLIIDRKPPVLNLVLRSGEKALPETSIQAGPGEVINVKADDISPVRIMGCWQPRAADADCKVFTELGERLVAPDEGEWTLRIYAVDGAGNRSQTLNWRLSIFDSDRVNTIIGWINQADLYLKQNSNFEALKQLYRAARTMNELKSQNERNAVRDRIRVPFFNLLLRNVPVQEVTVDEGELVDIWGVSGSRFIVHSFGDRRLGHIVKLYDLDGNLKQRLQFENETRLAFDPLSKRLLAWKPDGTMEFYDPTLDAPVVVATPRALGAAAEILSFAGDYALVQSGDDILLVTSGKGWEKIEGAQKATVSLSPTGRWLLTANDDRVDIRQLKDEKLTQLSFGSTVSEIRFARLGDMVCIKGPVSLKCDQPQNLLHVDTVINDKDDAQGLFSINPGGTKIAYEGRQRIYLRNLEDKTYFYNPFLRKVLALYFDMLSVRIYTPEGIFGWVGLPAVAETPKPYNPDYIPQRREFWTDNEQVFYQGIGERGLYMVESRSAGFERVQLPYTMASQSYRLKNFAVLPDQSFYLAATVDHKVEIYPVRKTLFDNFTTQCQIPSFDGSSCIYFKDNSFRWGVFVKGDRTRFISEGDFPGLIVGEDLVLAWNRNKYQRIAFALGDRVWVFDLTPAGPTLIMDRKIGKKASSISWVNDHYLGIVDHNKALEIWDTDSQSKIFTGPQQYDFEIQESLPVSFSPILDSFAIVGQDKDLGQHLEIWKKGQTEATGYYKFQDTDMGAAQTMKFRREGHTLLIGFHNGHVYVVKDITAPLDKDNVVLLSAYEDTVYGLGFLDDEKRAYTMGGDGGITLHSLEQFKTETVIAKTDWTGAGGWLEADQLFWTQYSDGTIDFLDRTGRRVSSINISSTNVYGSVPTIQVNEKSLIFERGGKVVFSWEDFDVWRNLCQWSPLMAQELAEANKLSWKACEESSP